MPQTIDFDSLLKVLFQEDVPIEEKLQEHPQPKRTGADISRALGEIFQTEEKIDVVNFSTSTANGVGCERLNEDNNFPLQACNLYVFMKKIVMWHFGMGRDYAIQDLEGKPLKSWFTIPEAIETAKSLGYKLTISEAREYLDKLIQQRYIETDGYKYRRRVLWDKDMEEYLRNHSA